MSGIRYTPADTAGQLATAVPGSHTMERGGLANGTAARWPRESVIPPLGALTTAPGSARAHVRAVLPGWHLDHLTETCQVVVSELVTNAVNASTAPMGGPVYVDGRMAVVRLRLHSDGLRVLAEVWDQAPGFPAPRRAHSSEEDGRGLQLVDALTRGRWGWQAVDRQAKVVWAELSAGA
jgi:anti-sigma regulatory factor (Ser/Thr protein kinase)